MTTNEYLELENSYENAEHLIYSGSKDSLNVHAICRQKIMERDYDKKYLRILIASYIEGMQIRLRGLENIKNKLERLEVTE